MAGSDPNKLMAKADKLTKLSFTRWNADWKSATLLYEQAANGFRIAKDYEKAKEALEKASKGQELISSPWDAAKHMESAAALAKELGKWNEVADFYRRASELYTVCGRAQPASDAIAKGARALEDPVPEEAIQLYIEACTILEDDGKEQMAFDLYRDVTSAYIKLQKYTDAAAFLLRWGLAADKCNATHSQCKAYLSAILIYLYIHDIKQAEKCYNDCSQQVKALTETSGLMPLWAMIMADVLVNFFPHTQKGMLKKSNDLLSQAQFLILITWSSDSPENFLQVMSVD